MIKKKFPPFIHSFIFNLETVGCPSLNSLDKAVDCDNHINPERLLSQCALRNALALKCWVTERALCLYNKTSE